jgi:hypothetical protein
VAFYHGGDPLYTFSDIPGMWHEECLRPIPGERYATEAAAPAFEPAPPEAKRSIKLQRRRKYILAAVLFFVLLIFLALVITLLPGIEALLKSAH